MTKESLFELWDVFPAVIQELFNKTLVKRQSALPVKANTEHILLSPGGRKTTEMRETEARELEGSEMIPDGRFHF